MCVNRITPLEIFLPILIPIQPKQMTTPRDSNIKDGDNNNNNQEINMRELIVTQTQLNQVTTQFLANNNELDPTMQRFLETQTQLMQKVTSQMINMGDNL